MSDLKNAFEPNKIKNIPAYMATIQRKVREFSLAEFKDAGGYVESRYQYIAVIKSDEMEVPDALRCYVYKVPKFLPSMDKDVNFTQVADISIEPDYLSVLFCYSENGYADEINEETTMNIQPNQIEDFIKNFSTRIMRILADPEDRYLAGLVSRTAEVYSLPSNKA